MPTQNFFAPHLKLVDIQPAVVEAWQTACGKLPHVTIVHGSIFTVPCNAIVSPSNSFGFLDGGIDLSITKTFGRQLQTRLQDRIYRLHHGELLVGTAEMIETSDQDVPYLIAAPTMRVPMILGPETVNPYLAMRGLLLFLKYGVWEDGRPIRDFVKTVAIPGLGTGIGRVPPEISAHQMRTAIEEVVWGPSKFPESSSEAQTNHQLLYRDQTWDLQQG